MTHLEAQAALLAEGDRLARHLGQTLHAGLSDQTRLILLGRSLATNLVNAFLPPWTPSAAAPESRCTPHSASMNGAAL